MHVLKLCKHVLNSHTKVHGSSFDNNHNQTVSIVFDDSRQQKRRTAYRTYYLPKIHSLVLTRRLSPYRSKISRTFLTSLKSTPVLQWHLFLQFIMILLVWYSSDNPSPRMLYFHVRLPPQLRSYNSYASEFVSYHSLQALVSHFHSIFSYIDTT